MVVIALALMVTVRPRELNFLRLLPFLLPLLVLAILLASRTAAGIKSISIPFPLVVVVSFFVTTTVWSAAPVLSVADSMVIVSIATISVLAGSFSSLQDLVGGVLLGCFAILVLSVAVGVALPSYGLVPDGYQAGSLRGVMLDRNSLSFVLLLGLIATLASDPRRNIFRWQRSLLFGAFMGGIWWTSSSTCLILSVVVTALAAGLSAIRRVPPPRRAPAATVGAIIAASAATIINSNFSEVLSLVNRDPSLTGRTRVWPAVENLIAQSPWLGQGWGAVWGNERIREQLARTIGFDVPHSHNGYLDVQVQVGTIGLWMVLLLLAIIAVRGVANYLSASSPLASWSLILVVVLILYNKVETSFSAPSTVLLMFLTLIVLANVARRDLSAPRT